MVASAAISTRRRRQACVIPINNSFAHAGMLQLWKLSTDSASIGESQWTSVSFRHPSVRVTKSTNPPDCVSCHRVSTPDLHKPIYISLRAILFEISFPSRSPASNNLSFQIALHAGGNAIKTISCVRCFLLRIHDGQPFDTRQAKEQFSPGKKEKSDAASIRSA